jgi:sorbitol/mannitol transport system substrate-binding protein
LLEIKTDGTLDEILAKHGFFPNLKATTKPEKKVKLVIGTLNNADMLIMKKLSSQFEAVHPEIELEWRVLEESTLRQRLLSDLAISDGQFDIMTIGAYETPIWAKNGWLTPIQKLPLDYDLDDVVLPVREALSYNKKLYALPFNAESSVLYYRTDLFDAAGLNMPTQPTYDEVLSYAAEMHKPQDETYGICLRGKAGWGENIALVSTMVNTYGGQWFAQDWQPQLNSGEWTKALTMYVKLLTKYGPPNPTENGYVENLRLFSEGKCAMWIDATVAAGRLSDPLLSSVSQHIGLANAPIDQTTKGAQWLWTWSLAVPESSIFKSEALKFIAWETTKEYIQLVAESEGVLAIPSGTRKSSYLNEKYTEKAPFAKHVLDVIQNTDAVDSTLQPKPYLGIQFVAINEFPAIGNQVGLLIEKVLRNEMTISEALAYGQNLVDEQMKASNYY